MNKLYHLLFATIALNSSLSYGAQTGKGESASSAIRAATPTPSITVPSRPITTGSAFMPGFASQIARPSTTGTVQKP